MKRLLSLLFVPQERNNQKALLLHPNFIALFIAVYLLNQSLIKSLTIWQPGVLGYSSEITIDKVYEQTNLERIKSGLPSLKYNPELSRSAAAKAQDMFTTGYWSHNSPSGKTPWDFFKMVNYDYSVAGENLAKDFYDTENMMRAWMKSPTHRDNILNGKYQEIGIGVVDGILNGVKTTLVVQHFGTPLSGQVAINAKPPQSKSFAESTESVLGDKEPVKTISPLTVSKVIGLAMFIIIITVLLIDGYLTLRNRTKRMAGSAAGHVGFLAIILLLILYTRSGTIF
ncbi:MAG: CAP domain-containing protein [Patescibacteria group bacterium]